MPRTKDEIKRDIQWEQQQLKKANDDYSNQLQQISDYIRSRKSVVTGFGLIGLYAGQGESERSAERLYNNRTQPIYDRIAELNKELEKCDRDPKAGQKPKESSKKEKLKTEITKLKNRARKFINSENYKEAIDCYDQILKLDPNNSTAKERKKDLKQLLKKKKDGKTARLLSKAKKMANDGKIDKAIDCLNEVIKMNRNNSIAKEEKKRLVDEEIAQKQMEATKFVNDKSYKKAIDCYDKILELAPNNPDAKYEKKQLKQLLILIQEKNRASTEEEYQHLIKQFKSLDYKGTNELANDCDDRYKTLKKERIEKEKQSELWEKQGLCKFDGGKMSGFFTKTCKICGRKC